MSVIEFSATKIDITVQHMGASHPNPHRALSLDPIGDFCPKAPLGLAPLPNLYTLALPMYHSHACCLEFV